MFLGHEAQQEAFGSTASSRRCVCISARVSLSCLCFVEEIGMERECERVRERGIEIQIEKEIFRLREREGGD